MTPTLVQLFERTVLVAEPWASPAALERGWVLWELSHATLSAREPSSFDVAFDHEQAAGLQPENANQPIWDGHMTSGLSPSYPAEQAVTASADAVVPTV